MFGNFDIAEFLKIAALSIIPFLFAVTIHEVSHGYAAYKLGDNTAKDAGRLTLNPIKHIDPLGLIVLLLTRMIGWAKPVPVNFYNIRHHKYGVAIVALAGPLANIITAILSALVLKILFMLGNYEFANTTFMMPIANKEVTIGESVLVPLIIMTNISITINIVLAIFNLIPIMPMDGARILSNFMSRENAEKYEATEKYYFLIILVLIFTNVLTYIITPIKSFLIGILDKVFNLGLGIFG